MVGVLAGGAAVAADLPDGARALLDQAPGARVEMKGDLANIMWGKPLLLGTSPQELADRFLRDYAQGLGVPDVQLTLERSHLVNRDGKFTIFAYQQKIDGLPVAPGSGGLTLLVLNGIPDKLVYVGADFVKTPSSGWGPVTVSAERAARTAKGAAEAARLTGFLPPELMIYHGGEEAIKAYRVIGSTEVAAVPFESYIFWVDASTGAIAAVEDNVYNVNINGHTSGNATPGTKPDVPTNLPVPFDLANIEVFSTTNSTLSDANGDFVLTNAGATPVTVSARLEGQWVRVIPIQGTAQIASLLVTPPGPANLVFNTAPTQFNTSQVNGHILTTGIHDLFKFHQPAYTGLDHDIACNVNLTSTCNAHFSGDTINFYQAQVPSGCPNTAYSTVVPHEYGHYIVDQLFQGQGDWGEGVGDCAAVVMFDTFIIGEDFFGTGSHVRVLNTPSPGFPCSGEIHFCGQVIAGAIWKMQENLQASLGATAGQLKAQELWSCMMIAEGTGADIDAGNPIVVLECDDDDGDIGNGTPNYFDIQEAFEWKNYPFPELNLLTFEYPNGIPDLTGPNAPTEIVVDITEVSGSLNLASVTLHTSVNGGPFVQQAMTPVPADTFRYSGDLPAADCLDTIDWYVRALTTTGTPITNPSGAPGNTYTTIVATGVDLAIDDDFEANLGWVVDPGADTGDWVRGVPAGSNGTRGDPVDDFDGSGQCYVTGNGLDEDLDGGPTVLTSPTLNLSGGTAWEFSYARWFTNDDGDDTLVVQISNNGGTNWVTVETVFNTAGWVYKTFEVADFVTPTANVKLRFSTSDNPNNSVTEAAVDAVKFVQFNCEDTGPALVAAESVGNHAAAGDIALAVDIDATASEDVYSEAREQGVTELRLTFAAALEPSAGGLNEAAVVITSNPGGATIPGITTSLEDANTTLVLSFASALPDGYTYNIEVTDDVTTSGGDRDLNVRALIGDVVSAPGSPQEVNASDLGLSGIRGHFLPSGDLVDGTNAQYDVDGDGTINALDFSTVRLGYLGNTAP